MLYFAYGSNMDPARLRSRVPSARFLSLAYLDDYRLAFTRRSVRTHGGVADAVPATSFAVVGIAFEVDDEDLARLDRAEGLSLTPPAYQRLDIQIRIAGERAYRGAMTYQVIKPEPDEVVPHTEYLTRMVSALAEARAAALERFGGDSVHLARLDQYVHFLSWLKLVSGASDPTRAGTSFSRPGLLLARTNAGRGRGGLPVIQIHPDTTTTANRDAVVSFNGFSAIGRLRQDPTLPTSWVAIDQRLRHVLGIPGQLAFGYTATVEALTGYRRVPLQTRTVTLRLSQARVGDAERRVAVLHPRNLQMLGVADGDFVDIVRAVPNTYGSGASARRATFRCIEAGPGTGLDYPSPDRVYLDEQCRDELGITANDSYLGMPLLIKPNLSRAANNRAVPYGFTVLLGISAFTDLIGRFTSWTASAVGVAAVCMALVLTAALALTDLRAKLRP